MRIIFLWVYKLPAISFMAKSQNGREI
jgi:hypothetical protein